MCAGWRSPASPRISASRRSTIPSLPPVWGNRDQLVQVVLNLVKNAAEAATHADQPNPEIVLSTAYQHGMRLAVPGSTERVELPLIVAVRDNGPGIPEDIRPHLFEPFVTSQGVRQRARTCAGRQDRSATMAG